MEKYVEKAIVASKNGDIAFAVKCNNTNEIVGTTRFYNVNKKTNERCWDIHGTQRRLGVHPLIPNVSCFYLLISSKHIQQLLLSLEPTFLTKAPEKQ